METHNITPEILEGKPILTDFFKGYEDITVLIFGAVVILIAIAIPKRELFDEAELSQLPEKK